MVQEFIIIHGVPNLVHGQRRKLFQIFAGIIDVMQGLGHAGPDAGGVKISADFRLNISNCGEITHDNRMNLLVLRGKTKEKRINDMQFNYNRKNND